MHLTSPMLLEVQFRARNILKAFKGEEIEDKDKKAPVPQPPADESRTDPRVGDASPTAEDLAAAKENGEGADPDDLGANDGAGDGAGPGEGAGDGAGSGEGAGDGEGGEGFDEFGHRDMDPREVKKAFPQIGHLFPDEALEELDENETPNGATPKILGELVAAFKGMKDVLGRINAELQELKKGHEVQGRELKKAFDANADLASQVASLKDPRTAPAAVDGPRAVTKALGQGQEPAGFTIPELNQLASSQKLTSHEIAMLCATGQRN